MSTLLRSVPTRIPLSRPCTPPRASCVDACVPRTDTTVQRSRVVASHARYVQHVFPGKEALLGQGMERGERGRTAVNPEI